MDVGQGAGSTEGDSHSGFPAQEGLAQTSEKIVTQAATADVLIHQDLLCFTAAVTLKLADVVVVHPGEEIHLCSPVLPLLMAIAVLANDSYQFPPRCIVFTNPRCDDAHVADNHNSTLTAAFTARSIYFIKSKSLHIVSYVGRDLQNLGRRGPTTTSFV